MPKTHDPNAKGWMYFFASDAQNAIKIGFTENVYQRLKTLQSGNPNELRLMGTVPSLLGAELRLHHALKRKAIRLEWYPNTPFIEALTDELQDIVLDSALDIIMQSGPTHDEAEAAAYVSRIEGMFPLTAADVDRAIKTVTAELLEAGEEA